MDVNELISSPGTITIPTETGSTHHLPISRYQLHLKLHVLMLKQLLANLYLMSEKGQVVKVSGHKSSIATPARRFLGNIYYEGL